MTHDTLASVHTANFPALLAQLGASVLVTTYQAGKLVVLRPDGGVLNTHYRTFARPMGLAADRNRLALGVASEIVEFYNMPAAAKRLDDTARHDAAYLMRRRHVTGAIDIHEMAFDGAGRLWFVNTLFSCLCTLDGASSFVPRWRPPFVPGYAAEDRCHLNGLALVDGRPAYVTTLGTTDVRDGWRADKQHGGCIIEIDSGEFVTRGLSMPHSPRWHDGKLWVLESGTGSLALVDRAAGGREIVCQLPGFTRGCAFFGSYAFVGLSKIRPTSAMDGVPIAERRDQLQCGVAAIDLQRGQVIGMMDFQTAVEEIFDIQLLPAIRFPEIVGFQKEALHHTFVIPPESRSTGVHEFGG